MYQEYSPDMRLSHLIETYWTFDGIITTPHSHSVLPDGCVDIIFDFGGNDGTGALNTGQPELVGTMTSALEVSYKAGRIQMMGIRFAPAGITAFTKMPVFEFTNQNISLPLSETIFDKSFYERLPDMNSMRERINYLNQYFLTTLHKLYIPNKQIEYAVAMIQRNNGQLSVRQIAEEVYLCERHFERKFKSAVGLSPKTFSNVMRFNYTRQYIKSHKEESLFSTSIACGYHDLAHMNKDFQRFSNSAPSELTR